MTTLNDYQKLIEQFAFYPGAGTGNTAALTYCALGLTGESGEVAEKIKKFLRDGVFETALVAKELGDVLWYVARMSKELNLSLEEIALMNVAKLTDRKERDVLKGNGDAR